MTTQPSIESLREDLRQMFAAAMHHGAMWEIGWTTEAAEPRLRSALSELESLRRQRGEDVRLFWEQQNKIKDLLADAEEVNTELESLRAENEALREENDRLRQDRLDYSAATTTEGLNASEWIWRTGKAERERDTERARADAMGARVVMLENAARTALYAVEALKLPCPMDPEHPQSRRNGTYASIALNLHKALMSTPPADLEAHDARVRRETLGTGGVEAIAAERRRQIEVEGWTPEHDDEHDRGEMAIAAAFYAIEDTDAGLKDWEERDDRGWPWAPRWCKPKDTLYNLRRAGALIAAEYDRVLRRDGPTPGAARKEDGDAPAP